VATNLQHRVAGHALLSITKSMAASRNGLDRVRELYTIVLRPFLPRQRFPHLLQWRMIILSELNLAVFNDFRLWFFLIGNAAVPASNAFISINYTSRTGADAVVALFKLCGLRPGSFPNNTPVANISANFRSAVCGVLQQRGRRRFGLICLPWRPTITPRLPPRLRSIAAARCVRASAPTPTRPNTSQATAAERVTFEYAIPTIPCGQHYS